MTTLTLTIELLDYWHAGTGKGRGPSVDAVAARSPAGLPYLPGKTVRGLLREGVTQAEESGLPEVLPGTVARLFGKPHTGAAGGAPEEGALRVSDAALGAGYEAWAQADPAAADTLFEHLAATAIERGTGVVRDQSLRVIEVAVPLTLKALVHLVGATPADLAALRSGAAFVRGLGSHRRRGLGRARLTLEEVTP